MAVNILGSFKKAAEDPNKAITTEEEAKIAYPPMTMEELDNAGKQSEYKANGEEIARLAQAHAERLAKGGEITLPIREKAYSLAMEDFKRGKKLKPRAMPFMDSLDEAKGDTFERAVPLTEVNTKATKKTPTRIVNAINRKKDALEKDAEADKKREWETNKGRLFGFNYTGQIGVDKPRSKLYEIDRDEDDYTAYWNITEDPVSGLRSRAMHVVAPEKLDKFDRYRLNDSYQNINGELVPTIKSEDENMRESIINKSTSQLMAERYAQGVPTGAYAKSVSIQKAGGAQDLSDIQNMQSQISNDTFESEIKDTLNHTSSAFEPDELERLIYDGVYLTDDEKGAVSKFLRILGKDDRRDMAKRFRAAFDGSDINKLMKDIQDIGAQTAFTPGGSNKDYLEIVDKEVPPENMANYKFGKVIKDNLDKGSRDAIGQVVSLPDSIKQKSGLINAREYEKAVEGQRKPVSGGAYNTTLDGIDVKKDIDNKLSKKLQ